MQETSRATGKRWGGITSQWGLGETVLPAASDGKTSRVGFTNNRLLIYTIVSRDIWRDSLSLEQWVNYICLSEVRFAIEYAIVNGALDGPQSIINSPATIVIPKGSTSSSSISSANIDAMWSAMSAGSKHNAVWLCNDDTYQKIDQLAATTSGTQYPEIPWIPAGRYGNEYATLKNRPVLPCEACPIIGTPGDLICCDFSDYYFSYLKAPTNVGGLSIAVDIPSDIAHTGMIGMPEGSLERRSSEHVFFNNDELALIFKFRGDGKFIWGTTATNVNGATVGPCAVIAQR